MDFDTVPLTNGSGYNISTLVNDFHSISRYGLDFRRSVATIRDHDLQEYGYQMATFAIMSGIVFTLLTFILLLLCCCTCFFRSSAKIPMNNYQYQRKRNNCCQFSSIIIILITILTMVTYIIGFVGQQQFNDFTLKTCDTIDLFVDKIKDVNKTTIIIDKVEIIFNDIDKSMAKIKNELDTINIADIKEKFESIKSEYDKISVKIRPSLNDIENQIQNNGNLEEILNQLDKSHEHCHVYQSDIRKALLITLIVLSLFTIIFIIGLFHGCLRGCSCVFGYIFMLMIALFGTISFIGLVAGSDFCLYSKQLPQTLEMDVSLRKNFDYYLYCQTQRPLFVQAYWENLTLSSSSNDSEDLQSLFAKIHQFMIDARQQLKNVDENFVNIIDECQQYESQIDNVRQLCSDLKQLKPTVQQLKPITIEVDNVVQTVECESITPIINDMLTNLCTNFYNSFFLFFLNSISATIGYFLLLCITICILMAV
ncbi:uncharacterized protein LOC124497820 [Dermatophagoides farinae]|uniref:uncharacterized protein LOC124497820 n=1 Tax=Dermatophagoides farinae TaxID=6954 RepID=UPI003F5E27DA